jgi:hypothetical protein
MGGGDVTMYAERFADRIDRSTDRAQGFEMMLLVLS